MILSFMQYVCSGKQRKISEAIDSFNDNAEQKTAQSFKDYLDGISNPLQKFLKLLDFENGDDIAAAYNVCHEFHGDNTDILLPFSNDYNDEHTVQHYAADLEAGRNAGHSLDVTINCCKAGHRDTAYDFIAIHDTDTNMVFLCINADYDNAEHVIEELKDTAYALTGSRNLDKASVMHAIEEVQLPNALHGDALIKCDALSLLLELIPPDEKRELMLHPGVQAVLTMQGAAQDNGLQDLQDLQDARLQQNGAQGQDDGLQEAPAAPAAPAYAAPAAAVNGIQVLGPYDNLRRDNTYNVILSRWPADSNEFRSFVNGLDPAAAVCFAGLPVRVKAVEFTSNDTLIRRLWIVMFDSANNMTFYTTTNGHPMVLKVNVPGSVFTSVCTQNSDLWRKTFWAGWQRAFNLSPAGVTLMWDRDRFYNRKFHLNITCPANVGRAVNGPGRVNAANGGRNAAVAPAGDAQQQAGRNMAPRLPRGPGANRVADDVILQAQTSVNLALAGSGNDDIHAELAVNRGHRPKGCPRDANLYFVVEFPGLEPVTMVDAEARAFLEDLGLWQGVVEPGFNAAALQFDRIKLCVVMDRSFINL